MSKIKRMKLEINEIILLITSGAAIVTGVLAFLEWIHIPSDLLLQMLLALVGILLSASVAQIRINKSKLLDLETDLKKMLSGTLEIERFAKTEHGIEYMAGKLLSSKQIVRHMSLYSPIIRWFPSSTHFEDAIRTVTRENSIVIQYLVNLDDEARQNE